MKTRQPDRFIYIVGEQQRAIIPESSDIFSFARKNMRQIETAELESVLANVFSKGQFFPGPEGALTAIIHELTGRSEMYKNTVPQKGQGQCTLITAFKRLDGEISVKVVAALAVKPGVLKIDDPDSFHQLLLERLPEFQQAFTTEAYAPDSTLIEIIKDTTMHHIHKKLN